MKAPNLAAFRIKPFTVCSSSEVKPSVSIIAVMWFKENLKQNSSSSWKQRLKFIKNFYKDESVLHLATSILEVNITTKFLWHIPNHPVTRAITCIISFWRARDVGMLFWCTFPFKFPKRWNCSNKKSFSLEIQNHLLPNLVSCASHIEASCVLQLSCCIFIAFLHLSNQWRWNLTY